MKLEDFLFRQLTKEIDLENFDCADDDINEFLKKDSLPYQNERLAFTYVFLKRSDKSVVAFFSLSNNCLRDEKGKQGVLEEVSKNYHKSHSTPFHEDVEEYPGVLIGRLGVHREYQKMGLGSQVMDFIKGWVYIDHKPAFRLLMLDAYNRKELMSFYKKNGFITLLEKSIGSGDETILFYFDMLRLFQN